ncbi:MAG: hypothetical protein KGJ79_12590 [Alphaproteobacteria bacterium]|nr:hypothetical protein [Alphaproteobacteria bacterium]MDE2492538.1 hypothetical protein [Alphaproteobacteria bacterium]
MGILSAHPAIGDDRPFITLYTTDLEPSGETEFEQGVRWYSGHAGESFQEVVSESEVEHGFTDNFQGSLYLTYDWSRTRPFGGMPQSADLVGTKAEFIYRFTSATLDPVGIALYFEPSWNPNEHGIETKILLQKNFLDDALRTVVNINFEDTWSRNGAGSWNKESALEFDAGAAYSITPHWSLALEFDNERGFEGMVLGGSAKEVSNPYFLGPSVQYADGPVRVVFGVQAQLPVASNPMHTPGAVADGFTADSERFRAGIRIAREL